MKMMLVPVERMKSMQARVQDNTTLTDAVPMQPSKIKNPDVRLKMLRQKRMHTPKPRKQPAKRPVSLTLDTFKNPPKNITGKTSRAKALLHHLNKNKDRIRYSDGELEFDGITTGDTNITDLTNAVVSDGDPSKTPGWSELVRALEVTGAPHAMFGKWKHSNKKLGWQTL